MKLIYSFYHFLGGAVFAIVLISITTLAVIVGTFMESHTGSHLFAEKYIYGSPFFGLILWGFFINILIAALRRWPFQKKHTPFLITHWGLLMILGGVLIKHYWGIQGAMFLIEGSASNQLMIASKPALRVDDEAGIPVYLDASTAGSIHHLPDLNVTISKRHSHSSEQFETFIKGDWVVIAGIPPFPVNTVVRSSLGDSDWTLLAQKTSSIEKAIVDYYIDHTFLRISNPTSEKPTIDISLKKALEAPFKYEGSIISSHLDIHHNPIAGLEKAVLILKTDDSTVRIDLQGPLALQNIGSDPEMGSPVFTVDLKTSPTILFFQDESDDLTIATIGGYGDVSSKVFRQDNLIGLYSYEGGRGGYSMQTSFAPLKQNRADLEKQHINTLKTLLKNPAIIIDELMPPLQLLWNACQKAQTDFPDVCANYLSDWNRQGSWLYHQEAIAPQNLEKTLAAIDWSSLSEEEWKGVVWSAQLIQSLNDKAKTKLTLMNLLDKKTWPFFEAIKNTSQNKERSFIYQSLTKQIFAASHELPSAPIIKKDDTKLAATLFSSYCRAYEVHLSRLGTIRQDSQSLGSLTLECPLSLKHKLKQPELKIEDNVPLIALRLEGPSGKESLILGYDKQAQGLKWPASGGRYLFRYQPAFIEIPYEVHLRRARQISYPNTNQPYSYESDLFITEVGSNAKTEATISMNNVYETWDGYRFYLASMTPSDESEAKRVQLVVNLDPAKYILTYPGAFILSLGIFLLFWLRPYKHFQGK